MDLRKYRTLGRTGLKVSRLGVASGYGVPSTAVEKAYHEYGVNYFFLSSPRFKGGGMIEAVGNLAKTEREKMVIALHSYDRSGMLMRHYLDKGLRSLKIEYTDILILGWYNQMPPARVLDTALDLKAEGKVRFIGMSGHNRSTLGNMAKSVRLDSEKKDLSIDIFMTRYNAVHRGAEEDIFPYLTGESRPGIVTYTTTCWGKLLKKSKMPEGEEPLSAKDCYRFALSNTNVDLCLTGPKNEKEMDEALLTLDSSPLSEEEMERVKRIGDHIHMK
jgi:aryl-alcohol dehydrogenase-like predicted oxidoreductase